MKIATGASVTIEYELKVQDGAVIESSANKGPLTYVQGGGKMLAGLENRLAGMSVGQEKRGTIPAKEAFGTEDGLPTKQMARKSFPANENLEVGRVFQARGSGGGDSVSFKIVAVEKDAITVRFLHPLVGRDIEFKVKVLAVEDRQARQAPPPPPPGVAEMDLEELKDA